MHTPHKSNNGLAAWQGFLAFASYVSAAGVLSDVIGAKVAALILVIIGGLTQATSVYTTLAKPIETLPQQPSGSG